MKEAGPIDFLGVTILTKDVPLSPQDLCNLSLICVIPLKMPISEGLKCGPSLKYLFPLVNFVQVKDFFPPE